MPTQPLARFGNETGIDVGLRAFLTTADGTTVEHPRHFRRREKRLKRAQQRLPRRSRRKKGSKRHEQARHLVAKHHQKALALLGAYEVIYLEDLRVANLVGNHHLSKSIGDAGWGSSASSLKAQ